MLDTRTAQVSIGGDTAPGRYPRITPAAVERAKTKLGVNDLVEVGRRLGFSRQTFWRLRDGRHDIRLSDAIRVANQLGWPLSRVFEGGGDE